MLELVRLARFAMYFCVIIFFLSLVLILPSRAVVAGVERSRLGAEVNSKDTRFLDVRNVSIRIGKFLALNKISGSPTF
jgi:hypothetical protein